MSTPGRIRTCGLAVRSGLLYPLSYGGWQGHYAVRKSAAMELTEVATGVHVAHTDVVNWVLLADGDAVTLVDTGYPGQRGELLKSLRQLGRTTDDVVAVLLTHAHVDHVGSAEFFSSGHGVPVYVHERELAHARRQVLHQAGPMDVARNAWRPGVLGWSRRIMALDATSKQGVVSPAPFPSGGAMDVPGRPVPVLTGGHTPGHTVFHLPEHGVVITGDILVTGHPVSRRVGPQPIPAWFDHDPEGALRGLAVVGGLDGDVLVPGHGEPWHGSVRRSVEVALTAG